MMNDLSLRLGGDMARKLGIDVSKGASPEDALSGEVPVESQELSNNHKKSKTAKGSKKTQHDDSTLWDALPKVATMSVCKVLVSVRLDAEVLEFFKAGGSGYQTRMNAVLAHYVRTCKTRL